MTEVVAWLLFPLLLLVLCTGAGLLAERAAGARLEPALLAPLGFGVAICAGGVTYGAGLGEEVAAAVLIALALTGLAVGRRDLGRLRPGPGAAAALAVYGLYIAPVALTGEATFLGYNLLNDTAFHLSLIDYLGEHGRADPDLPSSSFAGWVTLYMGNSYPTGSHELLATVRALLAAEPAELWQPFIAASAGLAAAAVFALLRTLRAPRGGAAAGAALALSGQLLFSYALQGGIKELTFICCLAAAAALGAALLDSPEPVRGAGVLALPLLAGYAIYGVSALSWILPFAAVAIWLARGRAGSALSARLPRATLTGALVFVVAGALTIVSSLEFWDWHQGVLTAQSELGPLAGPIDPLQASGVWLNGDYRFDPADRAPSVLLAVLVLCLAVAGLAWAVRRRAAGVLLFVVPSVVAAAVASRSGSPYIDAKLLADLTPAVLLAALVGTGLAWRRLRPAGIAIAAVLAGALLLSDAYAYREARPAPLDRLRELAAIGERFAGEGPLLVNEFEEYAKHYARAARPVGPYEGQSPAPAELRPPGDDRPVPAQAYTLDELEPAYVQRFPLIATRRSPAESRPPANYALAWRGDHYEVWRRAGPPPAEHVPLGAPRIYPLTAASPAPCRRRGVVRAALRPQAVTVVPAGAPEPPPGWHRVAGTDALEADRGGEVELPVRLAGAGRYRLWLRGSTQRAVELAVDGRTAGSRREANGPNQWIEFGTLELRAGEHRVRVRRPDGSLRPGDGYRDVIGPVALEPVGRIRVVERAARSLCGRPVDWLER